MEDVRRCLASFRFPPRWSMKRFTVRQHLLLLVCFASVTALTEYQPEEAVLGIAARFVKFKNIFFKHGGWRNKTPFAMEFNSCNAYCV